MSQYCVASDLTKYAIPATAITAAITSQMQTDACIAASGEADAYMRARYSLPLVANYPGDTFDPALVRHVAYIAAFLLMSMRGFQAVAGADAMIRENYYKSVGWPDRPGTGFFPGIERGHIHIDVVQTAIASPKYQLPQVWTHPKRGI